MLYFPDQGRGFWRNAEGYARAHDERYGQRLITDKQLRGDLK
jgi:hypothetical protein